MTTSTLNKLRQREAWCTAKLELLARTPTENSDGWLAQTLWTLKITMIEHIELERDFIRDCIAEETGA